MSGRPRLLFMFWGRRGPMSPLLADLGRESGPGDALSASRQNESFAEIARQPRPLLPVDTFDRGHGALTGLHRLPGIRRSLGTFLREHAIDAVVDLMPHVWSPLVISAVQASGARYLALLHDDAPHPGDRTGLVNAWLHRGIARADRVIALSAHVERSIVASGLAPPGRVSRLFLPDLTHRASVPTGATRSEAGPLRLLFLGRILAYKGLGLFVDACERLRRQGIAITVGVWGEGDLGPERARLEALGALIRNHWLSDREIADALADADVVVLSHVQASQSGAVSAAFGAGLPVVCTPVGGLAEQVRHGATGLVAARVDAPSLASEIERLATDRPLLDLLRAGVAASRSERTVARFAQGCAELACRGATVRR